MKRILLILGLFLVGFISGEAQVGFIINYISSRVIRAIDLRVQELQNEAINLSVLQKNLENKFSAANLSEIASWQQKQKDLYANYFTELRQVKSVISFSSRVANIVQEQKQFVSDASYAIRQINADTHFSVTERDDFILACKRFLKAAADNLAYMLAAISPGNYSMTDADRLQRLLLMAERVEEQEMGLTTLMQRMRSLSVSREKNASDIISIEKLYGIH